MSRKQYAGRPADSRATMATIQSESVLAEELGVAADSIGNRKKVVVIGAGWAGLAAAHELSKQVLH